MPPPPVAVDSDEDDHHHDDGDDEEEHLIDEIDAPQNSPSRLIVTHDGLLDRSVLKRVDGWMYKKGGAVNARGGFRNWKKRWFVLDSVDFLGSEGFELRYYDRPGGKLKGRIGLNDVDVRKSNHKNVKFEFQSILQSGGALQLRCNKEEERMEWIDTLNTVVAYLRKMRTSSTMLLDGYDPMCEDDEESHRIGEELAQNCQAFGPGLFGSEAGQPAQFMIEIHDLMGQKVTRGGMPITATISNESCLYYVAILENDEGLYFGHYTLGRCGKYQLSIKLNDEHHIFGSPFDIEILPSKTIAKFCTAEGEALEKLSTKNATTFTITAMDGYGNAKNRGGDPFEVGVMGPAKLLDLQDNGDGTYLCSIEALQIATNNPSSVMIMVSLYGKTIVGSPFKPIIIDGGLSHSSRNPSASMLPASPAASVTSNQPLSLSHLNVRQQDGGSSVGKQSISKQSTATQQGMGVGTANNFDPPLPPPPKFTPNFQQQPPLVTSPKPMSTTGSRLAPSLDALESQNTSMSRLERSRQRALMAKSLAENNSVAKQNNEQQTLPSTNNFNQNHGGTRMQNSNTHSEGGFPKPPESKPRQYATTSNPPPVYQPAQNTPAFNAMSSLASTYDTTMGMNDFSALDGNNTTGGAAKGSKLSQLAQRSKSTLQAKKMGLTTASMQVVSA